MVCETFLKIITIFKKLFDEDTFVGFSGLLYVASPDFLSISLVKIKTVALELVRASIIHI